MKKFKTPHEAARSKEKDKPASTPEPTPAPAPTMPHPFIPLAQLEEVAPASEPPKPEVKPVSSKKKAKAKPTKDAWGGRSGTRMSKINVAVIASGKDGITTAEVVSKTNEVASI